MRPRVHVLTIVLLLLGGCASAPGPAAPPLPAALDRPLPEVAVGTLDGRSVLLREALGSRPTLVSLWATWCEACAEEFSALRRLARGAPERGAQVAALSVGEPLETVRAFVVRNGFDWPQFVDPEFKFADALGQKRVPTTLVISATGRLVFVGGKLDAAALAALRAASPPAAAGGQ